MSDNSSLDNLRRMLRNRAVDLQNHLQDNRGSPNYQNAGDAEAVMNLLSAIARSPEADDLIHDLEFMNGEFLPRRRMAESVFNTLSLDMPRSHSDIQSFVRRFRDIQENRRPSYRDSASSRAVTGTILRPGRGTSYGGVPRLNQSVNSSYHAPPSVRIANEDIVMVDALGNNQGVGSHPKDQEDDPVPGPKEKKPRKDKKKKGKRREGATTEDEGASLPYAPNAMDSVPRSDTSRLSRETVIILSSMNFMRSTLIQILRRVQEAATVAAELVDRAQNSVAAGAEVSRKRSRSEANGAFAEISQEVSTLQQQIRIINPGAVQAILRDLSPLSDASLVTVLHLAREYQEALLPSVTGTSDTRRVLEAISMLEARIRTSALELVIQMRNLQGSIALLQDLLGENAELLAGPEIQSLRELANIPSPSTGPSNVNADARISAIPETSDPDATMDNAEGPVATASAPASAAPSETESEATVASNKTA
ncbi:hypothetical protein VKT23_002859 [Stygiomarasmius scandens]|uniref:Uncharacterized protein n=1 Tax=Marasmiellus scandens TaxID=2682957 RepID=A0ABR1JVD1_9AGAR